MDIGMYLVIITIIRIEYRESYYEGWTWQPLNLIAIFIATHIRCIDITIAINIGIA